MMTKFRYHILSSFWVKVLALFLMTLDHVAKFMFLNNVATEAANILQIIGRLGFPLFILLVVEGVRHTHNFGKYILRLGILGGFVLVSQIIIHHCFMDIYALYSPLIDIILVALTLYLLKQHNKKSWLALLPITYMILSYVVVVLEVQNNLMIWWFPFYLRSGYNIFALLLALGMFYAYPLTKLMMRYFGGYVEHLEGTAYERLFVNSLMCFAVFFSVFAIFLLSLIPNSDVFYMAHETYALFAVIPIFIYNGELGYNKNWFKYGAYVYFPLHLVIIFLIFLLI